MFEQSIVDTTGRRPAALAASVTVQTILVGILILIPLIYGDHLPLIQPVMPLTLPLSTPPPLPEKQTSTVPPSSQPSISPVRVFRAPIQIPTTSAYSSAFIAIDGPPSSGDVVGTSVGVPASIGGQMMPPILIAAPPKEPLVSKPPEQPHPVGGDVQNAKLIRKIVPAYPALARQAHISGTVHLMGIISKNGVIRQLQVISGNPLLVGAALNAVRQWLYNPTLLNGEAVEVIAPIDVIFTLSQ